MYLTRVSTPQVRRRGAALEEALLDAAWAEVKSVGYAALTVDAVARRAGTSRPVIYRRWENRAQLVLAAMRAHVTSIADEVPDTGSLRSDALAVLRTAMGRYRDVGADVVNGLLSELGDLPADVFALVPDVFRTLTTRATARGELPPGEVPPHLLDVPMTLARYDAIVTRRPPSEARLTQIVDDIFLPLVQRR